MGSCISTTREPQFDSPSKHNNAAKTIHKLETAQNESPAQNEPLQLTKGPKPWLDELPAKVCARIALFLSYGKPCLDALRLAETSECQRVAVLEALSFTFSNRCLEDGLETRWSAVFRDQVREIDIDTGYYEGCTPVLSMLAAPDLRKVTLYGMEDVMRGLAESASVKEIKLLVTGETSFETLNEMLYRLNLSHLSLACMNFYDEEDCAFFPLEATRCVNDFEEACDKVSYLLADCDHKFSVHPTWVLLNAAPSVERTTLMVDPPAELMPRLKSLNSIEIDSTVSDWRYLVDELGPAITRLETFCVTDHPSLAKERRDIERLSNCPKLADLELCILNGVEVFLLKVLPSLFLLRRLSLRWVFALTLNNVREYCNPRYHAPQSGLLVKIAKSCPKVEKLCLRCVRMSVNEQDEILRALGIRLQHIEISFNGQDEHSFDRIEAFLRSAINYNHGLRIIDLVDEDWGLRLSNEGDADIEAIEKQRARLLVLLRVLRISAPNLDESKLRDHITNAEAPTVKVTVHHEDGTSTTNET